MTTRYEIDKQEALYSNDKLERYQWDNAFNTKIEHSLHRTARPDTE